VKPGAVLRSALLQIAVGTRSTGAIGTVIAIL
jgi:hypothetical protein